MGLDAEVTNDADDAGPEENTKHLALLLNSIPGVPADLQTVGLLELLETDERPVLVFDLASPGKTIPVYNNPRLRELRARGIILDTVEGTVPIEGAFDDNEYSEFLTWATSTSVNGALSGTTFRGIEWAGQTLRARWRVISGHEISGVGEKDQQRAKKPKVERHASIIPVQNRVASRSEQPQNSLDRQLESFRLRRGNTIPVFPVADMNNDLAEQHIALKSNLGPFDFTAPNPSMKLSAHIQFFLEFDWASTDLGPIESWSLELRRMVNLMLTDPRAAAMYWSENRIMMYNEAYVAVTAQKHPGMMGQPFVDAWEEVADHFKPAFDKAYETGVASTMDESLFYIDRHGYLEETYYSISMIPFGTTEGIAFYNPVIDTTKQVISDRRMIFLLRIGQYIASSREPKDFWSQLLLALEPNKLEVPFAILYSAGGDVNETLSDSSEQSFGFANWVLEGSIRVGGSLLSIPERFSSVEGLEEFLPGFLEYIKSDNPTHLRSKDGTLPESLGRQESEETSCETAIFLPIRSTGDTVLGFLIIGVNPHKRYDDEYKLFIELLSRQLATSLAAAVLFEDETRRARLAAEQAATDKKLLSRRLAIQTHETLEVESRFRRMADMAPVGMFHINPAGLLVYANEHWYNLTQQERNITYIMSWRNAILDEDLPILDVNWAKLCNGEPVIFETRLKRPFTQEEIVGGEKVEGPTYVIAAAYPEKAEDGTVIGILGCITDISRQKWAEGFQKRKMMEAIELKRQQENFIDMTSHEMRNPLSAIIQCADFISTSVVEFHGGSIDIILPREVADSYTDAAQTIILCAQHQKRIIDDILTLSKLDSDLLLITPIESQPVSVIESALRMFDGDLQKNDVELQFRIDPSYTELAINWVKIDPSRMLQVLINLLTNAIKFTQLEAKRKIVITIGAALERPTPRYEGEYLPRSSSRKDMSLGPDWGTGEPVYLFIEVQDSGRGLTDHERNFLFQRFSQASPRTHVQYGGSGLGLFISRELTELQGGQIGVASKPGVGSVFAFYIRARRCEPPSLPQTIIFKPGDHRPRSSMTADAALLGYASPPEPRSRSPLLAPKYILVVEDNLVNQRVLSKQLVNAGCHVSVANHGGEALSYLAASHFWHSLETPGHELSLILMDLEMPIMDGLTCVKQIREWQKEGKVIGHVPVIAVTANARSEQIARAKEAGMDSVVTKPFRIPELMPEMDRLLRWALEREKLDVGSVSTPV